MAEATDTATHDLPQSDPRPSLSESLAPCHDCDMPTLVRVSDDLSDDQTLLTAIEMGVIGLGSEHECEDDANAVAELVRTLQRRLDERASHLGDLIAMDRETMQ